MTIESTMFQKGIHIWVQGCGAPLQRSKVRRKVTKSWTFFYADFLKTPSVLIEGVLFRARYLGSTQLTCEGQPTKATRMMQAEEAVSRIKVWFLLLGEIKLFLITSLKDRLTKLTCILPPISLSPKAEKFNQISEIL